MFSFNMKERIVYMLDPMPAPDYMLDPMPAPHWAPKDDPSKYYLDIIQKIGITLDGAMEAVQPEWKDDVYY